MFGDGKYVPGNGEHLWIHRALLFHPLCFKKTEVKVLQLQEQHQERGEGPRGTGEQHKAQKNLRSQQCSFSIVRFGLFGDV